MHRNLLASYAHLRSVGDTNWPARFVAFVRTTRSLSGEIAARFEPVREPDRFFEQYEHGIATDAPVIQPAMRRLLAGGRAIETDSEGYLRNLDDWCEDFVHAQAAAEVLTLTDEHWQVIAFLRAYYAEHGVQAQVRAMIRHFAQIWGPQRGNNHFLHEIFPCGGPQKQGNRLAGLLRTKGEH